MKTLLITGVSRGIGRQLATHFCAQGIHVIGAYKSSSSYTEEDQEAKILADELGDYLTIAPCDLADRFAVDSLISEIGNRNIDGIINNAAEYIPKDWDNMDFADWDRSVAVNMTAPLYLVNRLRKNLNKGSAIVNIASSDAWFAGYEDIAYSATKAGLISLTKTLAAILGEKKVRVNAIAPGWVDTAMAEAAGIDEAAHYKTPLGRNATTQEIVDVAEYLLSDKASFITGATISVDGGYSVVDEVLKREAGK
jgi:NAD(P)-dependent dehydrogenase (short-subunit alcohol dehydrogenase family)